ncbi:LytR C-terminal domain-containing protein [Microbacterium soli]|uniref:LytR/CpsA/Psr regulator C-terminal domain-containing protein n=1 Tax=Microbacterium soli TaxID=446075 RepID=A0ABP7NBC1_9MICO
MPQPPRDRFDDVPRTGGRVGAHRAEQPGINGPVTLLWSAAIALVLIAAGIFISLVLMGRIDPFGTAAPAEPQQTQGVLAEVDTSYRVLILNATPQAGAVATVRKTLIDHGWQESDVLGNGGSTSEFPETTVFYVEKADEAAALGVAELLGGVKAEQSDHYAPLNVSGSPQLTVVIGMDRVETAEPSPGGGEETPAG